MIFVHVLGALKKNVHSAVVGWNVLEIAMRSNWLLVKLSIVLLIFFLPVLSIIKRRMLKFMTFLVDFLHLLTVLSVFVSHVFGTFAFELLCPFMK